MKIVKNYGTDATTPYYQRSLKYIVIHYTAGSTSRKGTAHNVINGFKNTKKASADFVVDDGTIVQYNPDIENRFCWAVGGARYVNSKGGSCYGNATNRNCISIEMCCNHKKWTPYVTPNDEGFYFTKKTIKKTKKLVKHLMSEYNIPLVRVIRHYDVNGKPCPGIIGWNKDSGSEREWEKFKESLIGINQVKPS